MAISVVSTHYHANSITQTASSNELWIGVSSEMSSTPTISFDGGSPDASQAYSLIRIAWKIVGPGSHTISASPSGALWLIRCVGYSASPYSDYGTEYDTGGTLPGADLTIKAGGIIVSSVLRVEWPTPPDHSIESGAVDLGHVYLGKPCDEDPRGVDAGYKLVSAPSTTEHCTWDAGYYGWPSYALQVSFDSVGGRNQIVVI